MWRSHFRKDQDAVGVSQFRGFSGLTTIILSILEKHFYLLYFSGLFCRL